MRFIKLLGEALLIVAVFQFSNRTIEFSSHPAPFDADLVLLQPSGESAEFWQPVLDEFNQQPSAGGRILTLSWHAPSQTLEQMAQVFQQWAKTLGLSNLYVFAVEDAGGLTRAAQMLEPSLFHKVEILGSAKGVDLKRAVLDFAPAAT